MRHTCFQAHPKMLTANCRWSFKLNVDCQIAKSGRNISSTSAKLISGQNPAENTIFPFGGLLANLETLSTWLQFPQECPRLRYSGRNCHGGRLTAGFSKRRSFRIVDSPYGTRFAASNRTFRIYTRLGLQSPERGLFDEGNDLGSWRRDIVTRDCLQGHFFLEAPQAAEDPKSAGCEQNQHGRNHNWSNNKRIQQHSDGQC